MENEPEIEVGDIWRLTDRPEYRVVITEIQSDASGDLRMVCFGKDGYEHLMHFRRRYELDQRKKQGDTSK